MFLLNLYRPQGGYVFGAVCLFAPYVRFSVCLQDNRKTASAVLMKLGGMVWPWDKDKAVTFWSGSDSQG